MGGYFLYFFLYYDKGMCNYIYMITDKKCACGCGEILKNPKNTYLNGHSNRDPKVKAKKEASYLKKYGVTNPSKMLEIKQKKEQTNLKKFGTLYAAQNKEIQEKTKNKWIEKYGVDNPSKLNSVKKIISQKVKTSRALTKDLTKKKFFKNFFDKLVNTNRLGHVTVMFGLDDYEGVNKKYPFKCNQCQSIFHSNLDDGKIPRCFTCNPKIDTGGQSLMEKDLVDYIKTFNYSIIEQDRNLISPLEIDINIVDKKIGVEFNGLYWHSELSGKKSKFYHKKKQELLQEKGYQLIQIFEDEWIHKNKIVKNRLKHILGNNDKKIYARNCEIKEISSDIKSKFLKKYHIQGNDNSTYHLGLFYKNRLVAVMTFSPNRIALGNVYKENEWELVRYCSIFSFSIVGGASKLLSFFEKNKNPKKLTSYADKRWSEGNLYKKLNFRHVGDTLPNYWYIIDDQRKHRYNFQKSKLSQKLINFNENLTEWENMQLNGNDRIWDCGHLKFEKTYDTSIKN